MTGQGAGTGVGYGGIICVLQTKFSSLIKFCFSAYNTFCTELVTNAVF